MDIVRDEAGEHIATEKYTVSVLDGGKLKKRHFQKIGLDGSMGTHDMWVWAELDGVNVYLKDNNVIVTKQELR